MGYYLFEEKKIGQTASLVSYNSDSLFPEEEVVILEDYLDRQPIEAAKYHTLQTSH